MSLRPPRAILFDLDGTLADTAPDLAAAVNLMRSARGLAPTPYEQLRPVASAGARGLIGAAFGIGPDHPEFNVMRTEFLDNYAAAIAIHTRLFDGIREMLQGLDQAGLQWGIVTNKAARFTDALVPLIGLAGAGCVISGDTTPHAKPHPQPLLEAASRIGLPSEACWYVGDDLRDIQAGRAAGMPTIGAGWGYCGNVEPASWEADALAGHPLQLLELLRAG
ncbi:HAD-IA family hydrolase [Janthinobacterium sp. 17J80-10]|uniref:HAD family hydrolase n=1 Tax=Janthinobacterium sp. 17J80-10 TaxID=2497863 RepID=UPI00100555D6|nr:HAD-IA family hydrolase [Janthinobacterium sp. 17J80-10]QAU33817.1 HAD family hydrolase [Janthinobacterium sp. 17J80-10]